MSGASLHWPDDIIELQRDISNEPKTGKIINKNQLRTMGKDPKVSYFKFIFFDQGYPYQLIEESIYHPYNRTSQLTSENWKEIHMSKC